MYDIIFLQPRLDKNTKIKTVAFGRILVHYLRKFK